MSILIKGIEMPKSCYECPCFYDSLYCGVTYKDFDEENYRTDKYRQPDCPLIEIDDEEMDGLINLYNICKGTSKIKSIQLKDIKPIGY